MPYNEKPIAASSHSSSQYSLALLQPIEAEGFIAATQSSILKALLQDAEIKGFFSEFKTELSRTIGDVNQLIKEYNANRHTAKACLDTINRRFETFETAFPNYFYPAVSEYLHLRRSLKEELIKAYRELAPHTDNTRLESRDSLAAILTAMKPKHVRRLVRKLHQEIGIDDQKIKGKKVFAKWLAEIYSRKSKDPYARRFRQFLECHQISYIHNGNSATFLVESIGEHQGEKEVLKLDCFVFQPHKKFFELRQNPKISPYLVDIKACRRSPGFYNYSLHLPKKQKMKVEVLPVMVNVFLTDYFPAGSLEQLSKTKGAPSNYSPENLADIMRIFIEMATFLSYLEEQYLMMSDLKLANILCSYSPEEKRWKIFFMDIKSIVPVNENYIYSYQSEACKKYLLITSEDYFQGWCKRLPIDAEPSDYIDAKAFHSYLLAMNLKNFFVYSRRMGRDWHPVFSDGQRGALLKECIDSLMSPILEEQIEVGQAIDFFRWYTDLNCEEYQLKLDYLYSLNTFPFKERLGLVKTVFQHIDKFKELISQYNNKKLIERKKTDFYNILESIENTDDPIYIDHAINQQLTDLINSMQAEQERLEHLVLTHGLFKKEQQNFACSPANTMPCQQKFSLAP